MKQKLKKFWSTLLVVCMIITMLPITVYAYSGNETELGSSPSSDVDGSNWSYATTTKTLTIKNGDVSNNFTLKGNWYGGDDVLNVVVESGVNLVISGFIIEKNFKLDAAGDVTITDASRINSSTVTASKTTKIDAAGDIIFAGFTGNSGSSCWTAGVGDSYIKAGRDIIIKDNAIKVEIMSSSTHAISAVGNITAERTTIIAKTSADGFNGIDAGGNIEIKSSPASKGEYAITAEGTCGIHAGGSLTVTYSDTYAKSTVTVGTAANSSQATGIYSDGDISIKSTIKAEGPHGIVSGNGNITIAGGVVTPEATGEGHAAIQALTGTVNISNYIIDAKAEKANSHAIQAVDIDISGGIVTAFGSGGDLTATNGIKITGGSVNAVGNKVSPRPTNGTNDVYRVKMKLDADKIINGLNVDSTNPGYNADSLKADSSGNLYFWLPAGLNGKFSLPSYPKPYEADNVTIENNDNNEISFVELQINITNWLDPVFASYLRTVLSKGENEDIFDTDVKDIKTLDVSNKNIKSLKGINWFGALEELNASDNPLGVVNIDVQPNGLKKLNLSRTNITSLSLHSLPSLEELDVSQNQLTELNLATGPDGKPKFIKSLKILNASKNQLSSIKLTDPSITEPLVLEELDCSFNAMTSLDLSGFTELKNLKCSNNQLTGIDVTASSALEALDCRYNYMSDISNVVGASLISPALQFNPQHASGFVAVTTIVNLPDTAYINKPLTLKGTVLPTNASKQDIIWSIVNAGGTSANIIGNIFTSAELGTITLRATIQGGADDGVPGVDFTFDFPLTVYPPTGSSPDGLDGNETMLDVSKLSNITGIVEGESWKYSEAEKVLTIKAGDNSGRFTLTGSNYGLGINVDVADVTLVLNSVNITGNNIKDNWRTEGVAIYSYGESFDGKPFKIESKEGTINKLYGGYVKDVNGADKQRNAIYSPNKIEITGSGRLELYSDDGITIGCNELFIKDTNVIVKSGTPYNGAISVYSIRIDNSDVTAINTNNGASGIFYEGSVIISNSSVKVEGNNGIQKVNSQNINSSISNSTVDVNGKIIGISFSGGNFEINSGSKINVVGGKVGIVVGDGGALIVNGGTVKATGTDAPVAGDPFSALSSGIVTIMGDVKIFGGRVIANAPGHGIFVLTPENQPERPVFISGGSIDAEFGKATFTNTGLVDEGPTQPLDSSGNELYRINITILNAPDTEVTDITVPSVYGIADIETDSYGRLFFWLAPGETIISLTAGGKVYSGKIDVQRNNDNTLILVEGGFSYGVTVTGGTGSGRYTPGEIVTIIAPQAPAGQMFKGWEITPAVTFAERTYNGDSTAKFVMPASDVTVTPIYAAPVNVSFVAEQMGGKSKTEDTYGIKLTFNQDVSNLHPKNIKIIDGTGSVSMGALVKGADYYVYYVREIIREGKVSISIDDFSNCHVTNNPQVITVYKKGIPFDVTVNGGTGSGSYLPGSTVTITANTPESGKRFKEWSVVSGSAILANVKASRTTFTMPNSEVGVTANYEVIPAGVTTVSAITVDKQSLALYSNTEPRSATLVATVTPSDATDKTVMWQSSNTAVATVDANGKVTSAGNGIAIITVTTNDGGYSADCTVTVTTYNSGGGDKPSGGGDSKPKPETKTEPKFVVPPSIPVVNFSDVSPSAWYAGAVEYVQTRGLMTGTGDGKFSPDATATRAMLWTVLYRLAGSPGQNTTSTNWYAAAREWAKANDISDGLNPDGSITREQLVTLLYRFAQKKGLDVSKAGDLSIFADADDVSPWATKAMEWAVDNGIISGKGNGILDSNGTATRAEIAMILKRFLEQN